jgi:hypothetical protein
MSRISDVSLIEGRWRRASGERRLLDPVLGSVLTRRRSRRRLPAGAHSGRQRRRRSPRLDYVEKVLSARGNCHWAEPDSGHGHVPYAFWNLATPTYVDGAAMAGTRASPMV